MKKDYLTRLERTARWRLPPQEAEDVIADYRDIVADEVLFRELGKPRDVIRPLTTPKAYRIWLAVFAVMVVCILAPGISGTFLGAPLWLCLFNDHPPYGNDHPYGAYLAVLGAVTALVWFRRQGQKDGKLPKAIPVLLAVSLACIGWVLWFCWACSRDFDAFLELWGTVKILLGPYAGEPTPASYYLSRIAMAYVAPIVSFIGVFALVKARMGDRRWAAVYVLAVTAMLTAMLVLDWTTWMDPADVIPEEMFRQILTRCSIIAAVGLAGTGVALC